MTAPDGSESRILNIRGEKVGLGPVRRDLLPLYYKWINDFEVTRTLAVSMRPKSWETEENWYERASRDGDQSLLTFTIYELPGMRAIGNTGFDAIDLAHRTAEFGLFIGEKDCWGMGYATEVTRLMLDYGFTVLGLHNIFLSVLEFNVAGIRAYKRAGFREIGRRRQARWFGGRSYDLVMMDCLAGEHTGGAFERLLPE